MHWADILIGIAFGIGGLAALVAGLACCLDASYVKSLCPFSYGITFVVYGILHFAGGIGAHWATPQLRSDLFFWFFGPCLALWLLNWTIERREKKRTARARAALERIQ